MEPKPRGDKFSGSQLAVGKMVACALLRVKRSPFLNPPSALRPVSENSSAAFLLSPTEYFLSHVIPRHRRWRWGSYTKLKAIHSYFYWRITFATLFRSCRVMTFFILMTSSLWLVSLEASRIARHPLPPKIIGNIKYTRILWRTRGYIDILIEAV